MQKIWSQASEAPKLGLMHVLVVKLSHLGRYTTQPLDETAYELWCTPFECHLVFRPLQRKERHVCSNHSQLRSPRDWLHYTQNYVKGGNFPSVQRSGNLDLTLEIRRSVS